MAQQIIWTSNARQELFDILEFWNLRNGSTSYSKKLVQKIQVNLLYISENPFLGRPTSIDNVRVILVSNYLLFYEVRNDSLYVLSIFDGRRNPDDLSVK
ncbi:MAG: type II toxin-antitoxin system RelE/ParE family toxin [Bacteroidetes bacterium]|nr:type II toxin-antitoxin system RelE/ParE family toxin [Bacteroidota bacterium]